jgi:integrase
MQVKFRFTQAELMALTPPPGQSAIVVYDEGQPGLACRVSAKGVRSVFIYKKIAGRPTRKTLGRLVAGGSKNLAWFRGEAARQLGKIAADPIAWLEAEAPQPADKMTIQAAFTAGLKSGPSEGRGALGQLDWNQKVVRFTAWLNEKYPHVKLWAELKRHHVEAYYDEIKVGRAANTRRLIMQPITQTARHMAAKYEMPNPAAGIKNSTKLKKNASGEGGPPIVALGDVLSLLDWLRDHQPLLEAGVALQGLCGVRVLEVLRMGWRDVNLQTGCIRVATIEAKNPYSRRTVPVATRALEALQRAAGLRMLGSVEEMDAKLIIRPGGKPYYYAADQSGWRDYGRCITASIRKCNPLIRWVGKDLRNLIPQLAARGGWDGSLLELYLGHSANADVTRKHYVGNLGANTEGEREDLENVMQDFRKIIVDRIDEAVAAHYAKQEPKVIEVTQAHKRGKMVSQNG